MLILAALIVSILVNVSLVFTIYKVYRKLLLAREMRVVQRRLHHQEKISLQSLLQEI